VSVGTPGGDTPSRSVSPLRGVLLVAAAVIIGVLLLNASDDSSAEQQVQTSSVDQTSETTATTAGTGSTGGTGGTTQTTARSAQAHAPNQVKVLVLNGSGVQGAATKVANQLKAQNYVATGDNAPQPLNTTTVYYVAGYEADAKAIADLLKNPAPATAAMPNPPPSPKVGDNHVVVMLAADVAATAR
jgi:LytR cell envelope-related transcriptional attenuator